MTFAMLFKPEIFTPKKLSEALFDETLGGFNLRKKSEKKRGRTKRLILSLICTIGVLLILFTILTTVFCNTGIAYADDGKAEEQIKEELSKAVQDAIDRLGTSDLDGWLNSLDSDERRAVDIEGIKQALKELISGNSKDFFSGFLSVLASTLGRYFAGFLPSFITVIVICLLKSLLGGLTGDFLNGSTTEVVHVVCYSAIIIVLMTGIVEIIGVVTDTLSVLMGLSEALFPILLTLLSMLGGGTAVATFSPFMAALSAVIMKLVTVVIVPAFIATIVFSVVGNISKNVKLDKLIKLVKSTSTWLIGIVFGLFATFLTVQGVTGGVVDKFGFNLAKFALSSYVPILGGYLSDGFDLLSASLVLIKNAVGYTGVILLLGAVMFPFVKVVIFTLTLRLTAAIAEPIGDSRVASLMSNLAGNMSLLITALAGVAFLFFILLMLLIGSANFGV